MNRRKFLKALFSIPLLAVMPKIAVEKKKWTFIVPKYNETTKEIIHPEGFIWPTGGPNLKWSHDKFYHPNDGLCELLREVDRDATYDLINGTDNPEYEFDGLRDYLTTGKEENWGINLPPGKERLQQLDDYSETPFMDIQVSEFIPENRMIFVSGNGHLTWISNDNGLTWETLNGTELPKPTA